MRFRRVAQHLLRGVPFRILDLERGRAYFPLAQVSPELPVEGSNLDYLIQSGGPRALKTNNLTGRGVPTSIGALSV